MTSTINKFNEKAASLIKGIRNATGITVPVIFTTFYHSSSESYDITAFGQKRSDKLIRDIEQAPDIKIVSNKSRKEARLPDDPILLSEYFTEENRKNAGVRAEESLLKYNDIDINKGYYLLLAETDFEGLPVMIHFLIAKDLHDAEGIKRYLERLS